MPQTNKKALVLTDLFNYCRGRGDWVFHNSLTKQICERHGFANPFDVTRIETSGLLPNALRQADYFVLNIGKGRHQFVKGIDQGYHQFEPVADIRDWPYKKSILNELDTSESNILSVAANQKIVHDFLFGDPTTRANIYNARRSNITASFLVGQQEIELDNQQIEIDQTIERAGAVATIEAKNKFHPDFAVYQIYYPFLYYSQLRSREGLPISDISCCYLLRERRGGRSVVRLYQYTFADPNNLASVKIIKSRQYNLLGS